MILNYKKKTYLILFYTLITTCFYTHSIQTATKNNNFFLSYYNQANDFLHENASLIKTNPAQFILNMSKLAATALGGLIIIEIIIIFLKALKMYIDLTKMVDLKDLNSIIENAEIIQNITMAKESEPKFFMENTLCEANLIFLSDGEFQKMQTTQSPQKKLSEEEIRTIKINEAKYAIIQHWANNLDNKIKNEHITEEKIKEILGKLKAIPHQNVFKNMLNKYIALASNQSASEGKLSEDYIDLQSKSPIHLAPTNTENLTQRKIDSVATGGIFGRLFNPAAWAGEISKHFLVPKIQQQFTKILQSGLTKDLLDYKYTQQELKAMQQTFFDNFKTIVQTFYGDKEAKDFEQDYYKTEHQIEQKIQEENKKINNHEEP